MDKNRYQLNDATGKLVKRMWHINKEAIRLGCFTDLELAQFRRGIYSMMSNEFYRAIEE